MSEPTGNRAGNDAKKKHDNRRACLHWRWTHDKTAYSYQTIRMFAPLFDPRAFSLHHVPSGRFNAVIWAPPVPGLGRLPPDEVSAAVVGPEAVPGQCPLYDIETAIFSSLSKCNRRWRSEFHIGPGACRTRREQRCQMFSLPSRGPDPWLRS
jgi:hypothetical protein